MHKWLLYLESVPIRELKHWIGRDKNQPINKSIMNNSVDQEKMTGVEAEYIKKMIQDPAVKKKIIAGLIRDLSRL